MTGAYWVQVPVMGDCIVKQREANGVAIIKRARFKRQLGRVNMAERLRFAGKILGATISYRGGYWWISIQVEIQQTIPTNTNPPVGIDVEISHLATFNDGQVVENQHPLRRKLRRVKQLNKCLSRQTKGGKNWQQTKKQLQREHYHIACA